MEPPVHARAESDLPKRLVLLLDVEPDGESYIWAEEALNCGEAIALVATVATYGRRQYPNIPRPRGSLEAGPPAASAA